MNRNEKTINGAKEEKKEEVEQTAEDTAGEGSSSLSYVYRDFNKIDESELRVEELPASTLPATPRGIETSIRAQKFPVKLYAILARKEFNEVISWMPHGRSWKVLKPQVFESLVMPLFFEYSNYHSFNRLVNAWSFRRIGTGPDRGSYYHELFLRGKPHLQKYMRRLPKSHKKLPMKQSDEPDFYDSKKISRLPSLEEASPSQPTSTGLRILQTQDTTIGSVQEELQKILVHNMQQRSPLEAVDELLSLTNQPPITVPTVPRLPVEIIGGVNALSSLGALGGVNGGTGHSQLLLAPAAGSAGLGGLNNSLLIPQSQLDTIRHLVQAELRRRVAACLQTTSNT